jgi:hypothetical protein
MFHRVIGSVNLMAAPDNPQSETAKFCSGQKYPQTSHPVMSANLASILDIQQRRPSLPIVHR